MKKIILATLVSGIMCSSAFAATPNQGHGKVTFQGEIIDAPCSIAPESVDQTVYLGQISNSLLVGGGTSAAKTFSIELEDCTIDVAAPQTVEVSFTGASSTFNPTLLGVTGLDENANNIAIQINDTNGDAVAINSPEPSKQTHTLQNGSNTLLYSAFVRSAPTSTLATIPLGKFDGVTNFTLTYN